VVRTGFWFLRNGLGARSGENRFLVPNNINGKNKTDSKKAVGGKYLALAWSAQPFTPIHRAELRRIRPATGGVKRPHCYRPETVALRESRR